MSDNTSASSANLQEAPFRIGGMSIAEALAAISAFSIAIAIARIIGFFSVIDLTLVSLIDMSDVIALSFYLAPISALSLFFSMALNSIKPGGAGPSYSTPYISRQEVRERPELLKLRRLILFFNVGPYVVAAALVGGSFAAVIYFESLAFGFSLLVGGIILGVWWSVRGKFTASVPAIVFFALLGVIFSFSNGLRDAQRAANSPEPDQLMTTSNFKGPVYISFITHSHVVYTNQNNEIVVIPISNVEEIRLLKTIAGRFPSDG